MDQLQEELFIEIFSYLSFKDLCQLTLTCKSFNKIISNSSTLMDKFRLIHRRTGSEMMMKRNYQRIKIQTVDRNLMKFLKCCGDNICEIKINLFQIKSQKLSSILNFCSNLKRITIDTSHIADDLTDALSKLLIDSLIISNCDSKNDKILPQCNKKLLELKCDSMSENFLLNFLQNQKQLKTLRLSNQEQCIKLFDNDSLTHVDFQLETLAVEFEYFENVNRDNFTKFLKNQKSLNNFIDFYNSHGHFYKFEYANILNDLINVKKLFVIKPYFNFDYMPHIEILSINIRGIFHFRNFHNSFPNVNNLTITSSVKIKFVKHFSKPTLNKSKEFKISENLKTLNISFVKFGNDCLFDDDVDIKIENLTIYESDNIAWLIDCFENNRIKLKSLTIEATGMTKSQQEYLESLTRNENKKIEKLKISMLMKFDENCNSSYDYLMYNKHDAKRIKLN